MLVKFRTVFMLLLPLSLPQVGQALTVVYPVPMALTDRTASISVTVRPMWRGLNATRYLVSADVHPVEMGSAATPPVPVAAGVPGVCRPVCVCAAPTATP